MGIFTFYHSFEKNTKRHILFAALGFLAMGKMQAQFVTVPDLGPTDVSSSGQVSGYYEINEGNYYVWNPEANTVTNIGGHVPGNGIGGNAKFSSDGNYLSGVDTHTVALSQDLSKSTLSPSSITLKSIIFPQSYGTTGYVGGESSDGNGIVLATQDAGANWTTVWSDTEGKAVVDMCWPYKYLGFIAAKNSYFARTYDYGSSWTELDPAGDDVVNYYSAVSYNGGIVITSAVLTNGDIKIYYSEDEGSVWSTGSGLAGIPVKMAYDGDAGAFILVTQNGYVQKSTDNGATWQTIYTAASGTIFKGLKMRGSTGFATTTSDVYKTTDGGATWTAYTVATGVDINDVAIVNPNEIYAVGGTDKIYYSADSGSTWALINSSLSDNSTPIYGIDFNDEKIFASGALSTFYSRYTITGKDYNEIGRYNVATGTWSLGGGLGFDSQGAKSNGYGISPDGRYVSGNAWINGNNANAIIWDTTANTIKNLGSLETAKNSRANAVSSNGEVAVGYQETTEGAWKTGIWVKQSTGDYTETYLKVDPAGDTGYYNLRGEASCVSSDGNIIGGYGDYALTNPWIYNRTTGVVTDLGNLGIDPDAYPFTIGYVGDISDDGSIAVGWYLYSSFWGAGSYWPFIWTQATGAVDLNTVISNMGITLGEYERIYAATAVSPNGKYVTGYGLDEWSGAYFCFRLDLTQWLKTSDSNISANGLAVYPNPTTDVVNVKSSETIRNIQVINEAGQYVSEQKGTSKMETLNLSKLPVGVYYLKVSTDKGVSSSKVIKK